jgi:hypothetical protein
MSEEIDRTSAATGLRTRLSDLLPEPLSERLPDADEFLSWVSSAPDELVDALLGLESTVLEEVAGLLTQLGADAVTVLTRAESRAPAKGARKALRRAVHQLRSRGVDVDLDRPHSRTGRLPSVEEGESFVGPFDGEGHRIIVWWVPIRGGARVYRILASDEKGLLRVEVAAGRRSDARSLVRELRSNASIGLVSVPSGAVQGLLRALLPLGAPEQDEGTATLRGDLGRSPPNAKTPGEIVRARRGEERTSDAVAAAVLKTRIEQGGIAPWLLRGEPVAALAKELESMERSPLVIPPQHEQERKMEWMERAADRLFDPQTRDRLSNRLEETAYLLDAAGDGEGARAALHVARQIRETTRPHTLEFVRTLLEFTLEVEKRDLQEEQKGKLILP